MSGDTETIVGEVAEETEHLPVPVAPAEQGITLFGTTNPSEVVSRAADTAAALADVIDKRGLFNTISGKKYVRVEGWQLLGSMLGVFPVLESCEPVELNDVRGFVATVAAVTRDGATVGRASAYCMRNESRWRSADEYAVASMAQTRATSKCLRAPLGFIMQLAGYEATPEAEVPPEGFDGAATVRPATPEPDPPGPSPEDRVRSTTMARLEKGMAMLDGKPGWSLAEVLATASSTYRRKIADLGDLSETEGKQIISAMLEYGGVKV